MKLAILGHFAMGKSSSSGQIIKTKNLAAGLGDYGDAQVVTVDTHGWSRHPLRLLRALAAAFRCCDGVIMLPAHNGVRVFAPLLRAMKKRYRKPVYYDVIGGWLPDLLQKNTSLARSLRAFDGIWVETATMHRKLAAQGLENLTVIPNFKDIRPLTQEELVLSQAEPYKLCTFSRVMPEKGIQAAVEAVEAINTRLGRTVYCLDIYGQVEPEAEAWFADLQSRFPACVAYKGCVESSQSVAVLKDYFALLFPTRFYTEGIPGTILDAYAAGVPVISSRWESFGDIVQEGVTGIGYPFGEEAALTVLLEDFVRDPQQILQKKTACLAYAQEFTPQRVIGQILQALHTSEVTH